MLSKLPTKLTSPFGILGDDAKLSFRTQPGGIRRLAEVRVSIWLELAKNWAAHIEDLKEHRPDRSILGPGRDVTLPLFDH